MNSGNVGPVLVTDLNAKVLAELLVKRVFKKYNLIVSDYASKNMHSLQSADIFVEFFRYGPYTMCEVVYRPLYNASAIPAYTGYGIATKNSTDKDYPEAGVNISYVRAAKQCFGKYVAVNKLK